MVAMRIFRGTVALSAMLLLFSSLVEAQPPQGGQRGGQRGGFGGGFFGPGGMNLDRATLLGSRQVREELKIEDAQAATIEAALEAYRDERRSARPDFQSMRDMSEAERREFGEKMRKNAEALSKKMDDVLSALLDPPQLERLDQISLQARLRGREVVQTLKEDSLKTKLGIAEDQLAKLTAAEEKSTEKQQELRQSAFRQGGEGPGGGDREAMLERFEKSRAEGEKIFKELHSEAMAVLTKEQLATLETMKGKAFELDPRSLMGGLGRGEGAGRGEGGRGEGGRGEGGRGEGGRGRGDGGGRQRPQSDDSI